MMNGWARVVLLGVLALGCSRATRSKLSYGSEVDVEKLLAKHGAAVKVSDCENVRYASTAGGTSTRDQGVTRALSCMTSMTAAQASAFETSFAMTVLTAPPSSSGLAKSGECQTRGFAVGAPGIEVWAVRGRAKSDGWEYVELRYEPATGRACVETEYAWS